MVFKLFHLEGHVKTWPFLLFIFRDFVDNNLGFLLTFFEIKVQLLIDNNCWWGKI